MELLDGKTADSPQGIFGAKTGILFAKNRNRRRMRFSVHTAKRAVVDRRPIETTYGLRHRIGRSR